MSWLDGCLTTLKATIALVDDHLLYYPYIIDSMLVQYFTSFLLPLPI